MLVGGYYLYWFIYPGEITVYTRSANANQDGYFPANLELQNKIAESLGGNYIDGLCPIGCEISIPRSMSFYQARDILSRFAEVEKIDRGRTSGI